MIKTHKPRGHLWTCPSLFQQSTEIRNISFEDCAPLPSKVLAEGSDDELQPKQRAAKRRRIEKLADDFLNGQASRDLVCEAPSIGIEECSRGQ